LRGIAQYFYTHKRETDFFARNYNGDEFTLIYPETTLDSAIKSLERLYSGFLKEISPKLRNMTLSIGIKSSRSFTPSEINYDNLTEAIDPLLYHSKKNGRGKIVFDVNEAKYYLNQSQEQEKITIDKDLGFISFNNT